MKDETLGDAAACGDLFDHWNRCDVCGQFIALADFERGAIRKLLTPDSHFSRETYETLCARCAND